PSVARRAAGAGRNLLQSLPYGAFQNWLAHEAPTTEGVVVSSPIGYTTGLKAEKRIAGYLSVANGREELNEFDRLALGYGADVGAVGRATSRASAVGVEQRRGGWIQRGLGGTPADDDLLATRAQQAGFPPDTLYMVGGCRATAGAGASLPRDSLIPV